MLTLLVAAVLTGGPMTVITTGAAVDAQLEGRGARVLLEGTLERATMSKGGKSWLGTALVLDDGKVVWVTYGPPPEGWEPLLGKFLRVEAALSKQSSTTEQALLAPHLVSPGTPAEVKRALSSLVGKPVRLVGLAENAKGGAVVLVDGSPVYVAKLDAWPAELSKKRVGLGGRLVNTKYLPEATVNAKGEISQGTAPGGGGQYVLEGATPATAF